VSSRSNEIKNSVIADDRSHQIRAKVMPSKCPNLTALVIHTGRLQEISGMKIAINARARIVATEYMRSFTSV
jgi:hypothetical protein